MDETSPTNELIERLAGRLSPEGRETLEDLDVFGSAFVETGGTAGMAPETLAGMEGIMDRLETLPEEDQALIGRIVQLKQQAAGSAAEEAAEGQRTAQLGLYAFDRAHELEHAAGREPDPDMTLSEALAILERHGEEVPGLDAGRTVEVPKEPRVWQIESHVYGDDPDPFLDPDEDGDKVISNLEARVNDVGPRVPIRAEVYRGADKETVLRLLDKMRAHVEEYWEAR